MGANLGLTHKGKGLRLGCTSDETVLTKKEDVFVDWKKVAQ